MNKQDSLQFTASNLIHPVYLDTPMMVSFLATLDDGVSYSSEVAERLTSGRERSIDGGIKAGIPSLAQWLGLNLSADGRYNKRSKDDESVESKVVREHTSASLLNILRQRLIATKSVIRIDDNNNLDSIRIGELVEVSGTIVGDPLRRIIAMQSALAPYMGWDLDGETKPKRRTSSARGGRPKVGKTATVGADSADEGDLTSEEIFRILKADISKSEVLDLKMELGDGTNAVLTASTRYMTDAVEQYVLAGHFTVLGKVTQILKPGDKISMLRRTVLSFMEATNKGSTEEAFSELNENTSLFDMQSLAATGPGLQIIPVSIYV